MSELQKQPVASLARKLGMELDLRPGTSGWVYVQISEVAFAQGHQVTQSAKVGL